MNKLDAQNALNKFEKMLSGKNDLELQFMIVTMDDYYLHQMVAQIVHHMKIIHGKMDVTQLSPNIDRFCQFVFANDLIEKELSIKH